MLVKYRYFKNMNLFTFCEIVVLAPENLMVELKSILAIMLESREKIETVTDFIFQGSKVTVDGDCSRETKRYLFLGRKAMTKLNSVLKSRDITLPTKVRIVKAISSSHVWM